MQYTQQPEATRFPAVHNTSSAFSASANPNEDWTKISDLAERRRIQNRIAQRNYRKKLKRRLEDLERKTGSTSVSPEPSHTELVASPSQGQSSSSSNNTVMERQTSRASRASSTTSQDFQLSPEMFPLDDPFANIAMPDEHFDFLSPANHAYSTYPTSSDYFSHDFGFSGNQSVPHIYTESRYNNDFMHSLPPTLPSMTQIDAIKQDPYSIDEDFLNPFGISYANLVGTDVPNQQMPQGYGPRSPPSSDGWSSTYSRENSPPYFTQPMTPLSRPTSPNVTFFDQNWQL